MRIFRTPALVWRLVIPTISAVSSSLEAFDRRWEGGWIRAKKLNITRTKHAQNSLRPHHIGGTLFSIPIRWFIKKTEFISWSLSKTGCCCCCETCRYSRTVILRQCCLISVCCQLMGECHQPFCWRRRNARVQCGDSHPFLTVVTSANVCFQKSTDDYLTKLMSKAAYLRETSWRKKTRRRAIAGMGEPQLQQAAATRSK